MAAPPRVASTIAAQPDAATAPTTDRTAERIGAPTQPVAACHRVLLPLLLLLVREVHGAARRRPLRAATAAQTTASTNTGPRYRRIRTHLWVGAMAGTGAAAPAL